MGEKGVFRRIQLPVPSSLTRGRRRVQALSQCPAGILLGVGLGRRWAGHVLYGASSRGGSGSFRSQAENHVCEGCDAYSEVVRPAAKWTLHTPL